MTVGGGEAGGGGAGSLSEVAALLRHLGCQRAERAATTRRLVARLEAETHRLEAADAAEEAGGGGAGGAAADAPLEAAVALEEEREQQLALRKAAAALRRAEGELQSADARAVAAAVAARAAESSERALRAEVRRCALAGDAARAEVAAAKVGLGGLARAPSAAAIVPEVAGRWLAGGGAAAGAKAAEVGDETSEEDEEGEQCEEDEQEESFAAAASADTDADTLAACLSAGEVQLSEWQRQRLALQKAHGTITALRARRAASGVLGAGGSSSSTAPTVPPSTGSARRHDGTGEAGVDAGSGIGGGGGGGDALVTLERLQHKAHTVAASIETLTAGLEAMNARVAEANMEAVEQVRAGTIQIFESLVPSMQCDIECAEPAKLEKSGARFRIRASKGAPKEAEEAEEDVEAASAGDGGGRRAGSRAGEWRYSLQELSGGQRTLLNLALLLALARHRPAPVLLLDEIDAALDESNAAKVASILAELSASCQVIAISHRVELHRAATHVVRLHKEKEYTLVG